MTTKLLLALLLQVAARPDESPLPQEGSPAADRAVTSQQADPEQPTTPQFRVKPWVSPPPVTSIHRAVPAGAVETPRRKEQSGLSDLLVRSEEQIPVTVMIEELLDELTHQLSKEDTHLLSPMAIRWIKLSPTLRADMASSIEARLSTRLAKAEIDQVVCTDCRALRSRVEGHDWVVTAGAVRQTDLRRIAEDMGAKTFLDVDIQYSPGPPQSYLLLSARAFRASDGRVLFASAIRGDETTAAVLRTGKKPESRDEQLAELERKLEARPYYGISAYLGAGWVPYDGPSGGFTGATIGFRALERFGHERRHMYGLQAEGFLSPFSDVNRGKIPLEAGALSATYSWEATEPDLNHPELRLNWGVGAFLSGNEGNTMIFEASGDYVMKFRFSFGLGLDYLVPVTFAQYHLGGFSPRIRFAFNW